MPIQDFTSRQILIESDGFGRGTKVSLPDGTDLSPFIKAIRWEVAAGVAQVWIQFLPPQVKVAGQMRPAVIDEMEAEEAETADLEDISPMTPTRANQFVLPGSSPIPPRRGIPLSDSALRLGHFGA